MSFQQGTHIGLKNDQQDYEEEQEVYEGCLSQYFLETEAFADQAGPSFCDTRPGFDFVDKSDILVQRLAEEFGAAPVQYDTTLEQQDHLEYHYPPAQHMTELSLPNSQNSACNESHPLEQGCSISASDTYPESDGLGPIPNDLQMQPPDVYEHAQPGSFEQGVLGNANSLSLTSEMHYNGERQENSLQGVYQQASQWQQYEFGNALRPQSTIYAQNFSSGNDHAPLGQSRIYPMTVDAHHRPGPTLQSINYRHNLKEHGSDNVSHYIEDDRVESVHNLHQYPPRLGPNLLPHNISLQQEILRKEALQRASAQRAKRCPYGPRCLKHAKHGKRGRLNNPHTHILASSDKRSNTKEGQQLVVAATVPSSSPQDVPDDQTTRA